MKNIKKLPIAIAFFVVFMVSFTPVQAAIPSQILTEPPRDQVVWSTGAATAALSFKPHSADPEPWVCVMYETLYGYNDKTASYVPAIALGAPSYDVGGATITVDLNPLATFSNGRTINATDVVLSYELAATTAKFASELPQRFVSYTALDADTVQFTMQANSTYSKLALNFLSRDVPIIPGDIWLEINASVDGALDTFDNDWLHFTFPEAWKVTSGPYVPVYRDAAQSSCVYQYRDDWWGEGVLYQDIPRIAEGLSNSFPKYVGHKLFIDNDEKNLAFVLGQIDLHSGAISNIWELWDNPSTKYGSHIYSYYLHDAPYFACLGGTICVGFNQMHWNATGHVDADGILYEHWFREALAWTIDYDAIPIPAIGGYWKRAMPGFLDDVAHSYYCDTAMNAQYMRSFDTDEAERILNDNGISFDATDDRWEWDGNSSAVQEHAWTMICPAGWDDVRIFTQMVCSDFQDFGFDITYEGVDVATPGSWGPNWENRIVQKDYDLMMDCGGAHNILSAQLYYKKLQDAMTWGANVTGWHNSTWTADYSTLDTEYDQATLNATYDEMQLILAREVPSIPCFVNAFLYAFMDYYWKGWTTTDNDWQQLISTATNDQFVAKTKMILNLYSTGVGEEGIPWTGLEIFMLLGLVSTIILAGYRIKKKRN
jgi:ABC-type transport system substrate-binding protein